MNNILIKAINDFNKFKHDDEHIYTYKTYEGKWLQKGGFLVITSDYEEDDYDREIDPNMLNFVFSSYLACAAHNGQLVLKDGLKLNESFQILKHFQEF
jgi:hypothetical protein